jgi:heme/copper-type cytochrome/quinol oxidase subunit 3
VTTDAQPEERPERSEGFLHLNETPEEIAFELRAQEGALWTGGRLLIGIWAFAFAALAFAYFYLRSANNEDLWRPGGITAPTGAGAAIFAITVACALLGYHGLRRFRAGVSLDWEVAGWMVVLGGLIAVGLQIWQLTDLPFFPGSSGYASCFIGWSVMNIALILSGIYWIETLLARQARLRKALREDGGTAQSTLPVARMFRANLEGCAYYWGFIAVVATFFWVLFYVL